MKTLTKKRIEKIEKFIIEVVKTKHTDFIEYIDIEKIDVDNAFQSIEEMISDNNGFNVEIIYYSTAMEYLKENDPSLDESLEIASDFGFELKNLNSEILASLLASQENRNLFSELETEITEFFENL